MKPFGSSHSASMIALGRGHYKMQCENESCIQAVPSWHALQSLEWFHGFLSRRARPPYPPGTFRCRRGAHRRQDMDSPTRRRTGEKIFEAKGFHAHDGIGM